MAAVSGPGRAHREVTHEAPRLEGAGALPWWNSGAGQKRSSPERFSQRCSIFCMKLPPLPRGESGPCGPEPPPGSSGSDGEEVGRSEEHTSELQSRGHLVCRLLLEKK